MNVNYKIVGGGSYSALYSESGGDACSKFDPSFRDQVQTSPGYGAANASLIPQSNTVGSVTFAWKSSYATPDAALAAINTLRSTFKGQAVHLEAIQGATTVYFPNATLTSSAHDQSGIQVLHTMTFSCNDITSTAP